MDVNLLDVNNKKLKVNAQIKIFKKLNKYHKPHSDMPIFLCPYCSDICNELLTEFLYKQSIKI